MIRSGLVIQSRTKYGSGSYPSDYNPDGRWGTDYTVRPSSLPNQFDTGFQTTKTISPFQQSIKITRLQPNSLYKPSKGDLKMKALKTRKVKRQFKTRGKTSITPINEPRLGQIFYDDIFGQKANELVDYVSDKLTKSYFKNVPVQEHVAQGLKGDQGIQGVQGVAGSIGPQGPQGQMGLTGQEGMRGAQGFQGPQGETGPEGQMGLTGAEGAMGPMGLMGPQGAMGPMGLMGPQGEMGPMGLMGPQGPQGLIGNSPSPEQIQFLIQEQLSGLPNYLQNLVQNQLVGLPNYIKAEILDQVQDIPLLIEANSIGLNDVKPIISQMIEDARPTPADIFTNQQAILNIPQETETGNVVFSAPLRLLEYPQSKPLLLNAAPPQPEPSLLNAAPEPVEAQDGKRINASVTEGASYTEGASKRPKIRREAISKAEQAKITFDRQVAELESKIRVLSKKKQTNKIINQISQLEGALMRLKAQKAQ